MTRIKISGITHADDAALAASLGVDLVACVFNAQSRRYVTVEQAWAIRRALGPTVRFVGVFVDTPPPLVERVAETCQLDLVQLFGSESRADLDAVGFAAFKAVTVADAEAVDGVVRSFAATGRRARRPDSPGLLLHLTGALGTAWDVAAGPSSRVPLLLAASGLMPDTVEAAIATVRPWGVDVWDAVEAEPGRLDPIRLRAFIRAVRSADSALADPPKTEERFA